MTEGLITRTTFHFTVLHRTDEPLYDIEEAMARSMDGNAVGQVSGTTVTTLDNDEVPDELIALDNDGTFFDDDLEEANDV